MSSSMSCEVANSPFSDSLANPFDNANKHEHIDLSAITNFNSTFDGLGDGVDPFNFSNAASPSHSLDHTTTPEPSFDFYSNCSDKNESPFFPPTEQGPPSFIPPRLQNQYLHRRSVSEPPDDALMHHRPRLEPGIVFHRDGRRLGAPAPRSSAGPPHKRARPSRPQPTYPRAPPLQPQSRYPLRRAFTQKPARPPTSMPASMMAPQQMLHHGFEPMQEESQYGSSRVCTPVAVAIDPMLLTQSQAQQTMMAHAQPSNSAASGNATTQRAVVIKMSVDELRALITDVVQKAVAGLQIAKIEDDALLQCDSKEGAADAEMGDEIVVDGPHGETVVETIE